MTAREHDAALVEKAAEALLDWGASPDGIRYPDLYGRCDCVTRLARAVLDAVADDLRAEAWDEGYLTGDPWHRRGKPEDSLARSPYRKALR